MGPQGAGGWGELERWEVGMVNEIFAAFAVITRLQVWPLEGGGKEGKVPREQNLEAIFEWASQNTHQSWIRMNRSKVPVLVQELGFRSWPLCTDFLKGCVL